MLLEHIILILAIAFVLQFLDSSAGMGFGTLTPILLLLGFSVLEVIPAVIFASAVLSLFAAYLHHDFENVDFYKKKNKKTLVILVLFGIVPVLVAAFIALEIPETYLKIYIGILVVALGAYVLTNHVKKHKYSFKRITAFASLASFNKGISGGGYGPVLAGGQIISGVNPKAAVSMTALSEGVVSVAGFLMFLFFEGFSAINWSLILILVIAGLASTPLAAYFVSRYRSKNLKYFVGALSMVVGAWILVGLFV